MTADCKTANGGFVGIAAARNGFSSYLNAGTAYGTIKSIGEKVRKTDVSDYDLIILEFGANDFRSDTNLGQAGSLSDTILDLNTFCGQARDCIEYLLVTYPEKPILIIADSQIKSDSYDNDHINAANKKLVDYIDGTKAVAALYGLPVCDLYLNSGINPKTVSVYTKDGVSLNELGHKTVGNLVASAIGNMYCRFAENSIFGTEDIDVNYDGLPFNTLPFGGADGYLLSDGSVVEDLECATTGFTAVQVGEFFRYIGSTLYENHEIVAVLGYDENQTPIGEILGKGDYRNGQVFTIPEGVSFIRCCFWLAVDSAIQKAAI